MRYANNSQRKKKIIQSARSTCIDGGTNIMV